MLCSRGIGGIGGISGSRGSIRGCALVVLVACRSGIIISSSCISRNNISCCTSKHCIRGNRMSTHIRAIVYDRRLITHEYMTIGGDVVQYVWLISLSVVNSLNRSARCYI